MTAARGFTLIELMLVIVIMSIFAAMVSLAVGGSAERQLLLSRDQLRDDLAVIQLESIDQSRLLALALISAKPNQPAAYQVVTLNLAATEADQRWPIADGFKARALPDRVRLQITPLKNDFNFSGSSSRSNSPRVAILNDSNAPKLIWLGNGEATPVRLQLMQDQTPVGAPLYVTATGQVSEQEQGDDDDRDSDRNNNSNSNGQS